MNETNMQQNLAQVLSKKSVELKGPAGDVALVQSAITSMCRQDACGRGPDYGLDEYKDARSIVALRSSPWALDRNRDWVVNTINTDSPMELDLATLEQQWRHTGYTSPAGSVTASASANNAGVLSAPIGAALATAIQVPAFMLMFYQNVNANLAEIVGSVTGTLSDGTAFNSDTFDVYPMCAGKFLVIFLVPFKLVGTKVFAMNALVGPANLATLATTSAPSGITGSISAITPAHGKFASFLRLLRAQCCK